MATMLHSNTRQPAKSCKANRQVDTLCLISSIRSAHIDGTKKKTKLSSLIYWVWLIPIAMGGIIEVLQATCTGGRRSGEWLDFVADGIGSTLALLIGILLAKYYAKG